MRLGVKPIFPSPPVRAARHNYIERWALPPPAFACSTSMSPTRLAPAVRATWRVMIGRRRLTRWKEAAKLGVSFTGARALQRQSFIYGRQPDEDYFALAKMSRRCVIAAGRLGIKRITIHPLTDTVNTEYDNGIQKRTNIEFYSPMMELAKACGTGLAVENIAEVDLTRARRTYCANTDDLIDLVDTVRDPVLGVCWDFGHARMMFSDQPRQLRQIGRRLCATHVQDNTGRRDSHLIPFVGGNIRWEEIMPVLR